MNIYIFIIISIIWGIGVIFFKKYRIWFFYYLLGTIGLAFILVHVNKNIFHTEIQLAQSVALSVHHIGNLFNIRTQIFPKAPGLLLVLVVVQKVGWTALEIGVESSSLLEMCVLSSLVLFYPGWNWRARLGRLVLGLVLTWSANAARMLLIVMMLHLMGKTVLVIAHTFLGKLFFFIATIAIYWILITLPSLKLIEENIIERRNQAGKA